MFNEKAYRPEKGVQPCYSRNLAVVTQKTKAVLRSFVNSQTTKGNTNYSQAFEAAFDYFISSDNTITGIYIYVHCSVWRICLFSNFSFFFIFALYDLIDGSSLRQSDPVCVWWRQLGWRQRIDGYSWSQRTARELGCHPYICNW